MDVKREPLAKRKPIESWEIGSKMQKAMGIDGKIMIKQIKGGAIQFSIATNDFPKLLPYLDTVPGFDRGLHVKNQEDKGRFTELTVESFFKLRLLAHLFFNSADEKKDTNAIADLIEELTGIKAEYSQIKRFFPALKDFRWDPDIFMMFHQEAMMCSQVRKLVQAHTIVFLEQHAAEFKPKRAIKMPIDGKIEPRAEALPIVVEVVSQDCLVAARELLKENQSVCVLNMANQFHPGGGAGQGAGAQEEDLYRRTDLAKSLHPADYQEKDAGFGEFNVLYSSGVTVFRAGQAEGYAVFEPKDRFKVNVVSSAAYNLGKQGPTYKNPESPEYEEGMKRKIRGQLRAAQEHGDRALVLSAFGCGAFHNNPAKVAQFYFDVMSEIEFEAAFDIVQFAIIPNPAAKENDNFVHFQKAFQGKVFTREELKAPALM